MRNQSLKEKILKKLLKENNKEAQKRKSSYFKLYLISACDVVKTKRELEEVFILESLGFVETEHFEKYFYIRLRSKGILWLEIGR